MSHLRVALFEGQPLMRRAIVAAFADAGTPLISVDSSASGLLQSMQRGPPDVVLVDPEFELGGGLALLQKLRAEFPRAALVCFSAARSPSVVHRWLRLPGIECVDKRVTDVDDLLRIVRSMGRRPGGRRESVQEPSNLAIAGLTLQERVVLRHIGAGEDNLKISAILGIAEATVKKHVSAIYRKLGRETRTELALAAWNLLDVKTRASDEPSLD